MRPFQLLVYSGVVKICCKLSEDFRTSQGRARQARGHHPRKFNLSCARKVCDKGGENCSNFNKSQPISHFTSMDFTAFVSCTHSPLNKTQSITKVVFGTRSCVNVDGKLVRIQRRKVRYIIRESASLMPSKINRHRRRVGLVRKQRV